MSRLIFTLIPPVPHSFSTVIGNGLGIDSSTVIAKKGLYKYIAQAINIDGRYQYSLLALLHVVTRGPPRARCSHRLPVCTLSGDHLCPQSGYISNISL
jgi:hypothetical protein